MFKRTCAYCHVSIEAETFKELGLEIDQEHVEINERRRENKKPHEKYLRELKEFNEKRDKIVKEFGNFEKYNKDKKVVEINVNGYTTGYLQTILVEEKTFHEPRKPKINMLTEQYIKCKVCGHKYYLDGSNEYGFPTI